MIPFMIPHTHTSHSSAHFPLSAARLGSSYLARTTLIFSVSIGELPWDIGPDTRTDEGHDRAIICTSHLGAEGAPR